MEDKSFCFPLFSSFKSSTGCIVIARFCPVFDIFSANIVIGVYIVIGFFLLRELHFPRNPFFWGSFPLCSQTIDGLNCSIKPSSRQFPGITGKRSWIRFLLLNLHSGSFVSTLFIFIVGIVR